MCEVGGSDYDGIDLGILYDLGSFEDTLCHAPLVLAFGDELGVFVAYRRHLGPGIQLNSRHVVIVADCSRADDCDAYGLLSQLEFSIGHGIMDLSDSSQWILNYCLPRYLSSSSPPKRLGRSRP